MRAFAVAVVIPAHNEAATLGNTIRSVLASLREARVERSIIVVVADDCSDGTERAAEKWLRPHDQLVVIQRRCVGAARAAGAAAAIAGCEASPRWLWILNIDADSTAPRTWVREHLRHARSGAHGVAGVVRLDPAAPLTLRQHFNAIYRQGFDGRSHHHVHGANLSIRADTLIAVGNWPELQCGEDHALWNAARNVAHRLVSDPTIVVYTSARTWGRAPDGFAADLRAM